MSVMAAALPVFRWPWFRGRPPGRCRRWHHGDDGTRSGGKCRGPAAAARLRSPCCGAVLAGWGWARRQVVAMLSGPEEFCPRRGRCRRCGRSQRAQDHIDERKGPGQRAARRSEASPLWEASEQLLIAGREARGLRWQPRHVRSEDPAVWSDDLSGYPVRPGTDQERDDRSDVGWRSESSKGVELDRALDRVRPFPLHGRRVCRPDQGRRR